MTRYPAPKRNGRPLPKKEREKFLSWKHEFYDMIRMGNPKTDLKEAEIIAHNCAYLVLTDRHTAQG